MKLARAEKCRFVSKDNRLNRGLRGGFGFDSWEVMNLVLAGLFVRLVEKVAREGLLERRQLVQRGRSEGRAKFQKAGVAKTPGGENKSNQRCKATSDLEANSGAAQVNVWDSIRRGCSLVFRRRIFVCTVGAMRRGIVELIGRGPCHDVGCNMKGEGSKLD